MNRYLSGAILMLAIIGCNSAQTYKPEEPPKPREISKEEQRQIYLEKKIEMESGLWLNYDYNPRTETVKQLISDRNRIKKWCSEKSVPPGKWCNEELGKLLDEYITNITADPYKMPSLVPDNSLLDGNES